jgi:Nucleotidyl transferase AbiEii toxin, Type IV TA system
MTNPVFRQFLDLPEEERRAVFEDEADQLGTQPTYVEKDFWVCIVLDILYNGLPSGQPQLLFKGGTSLSKVHGLIRRFSEDVDISVFRTDLGFVNDKDPASPEISNKKRKKLIEELKTTASNYIRNELRKNLSRITIELSSNCYVEIGEEDKDQSTLLLQYPSLFQVDNAEYIRPRVKIEGGGRSALDPHSIETVRPFIDDLLKDWDFSVPNIITIRPERTFWDKIFILHSWCCRYRDNYQLLDDPQRLSRHFYDVAMISKNDIGASAVLDDQLRQDTLQHRKLFFNSPWMKLDKATPGSISLVPDSQFLKELRSDYLLMQGMMLGNAPDFDEIIEELKRLEILINDPK